MVTCVRYVYRVLNNYFVIRVDDRLTLELANTASRENAEMRLERDESLFDIELRSVIQHVMAN